jgi:uncharacterized membrane protein
MVEQFPIALTGAGIYFILLVLINKSANLERFAFADLALATISVIAAGLIGMRDNINIYSGNSPNYRCKKIMAIVLLFILGLIVLAVEEIRYIQDQIITEGFFSLA